MNNQTTYELHELRRRSGRTWEGMARWFSVEPQTFQEWLQAKRRMGNTHRRFMADMLRADWPPRKFRPVIIQGGKIDAPKLPRFALN